MNWVGRQCFQGVFKKLWVFFGGARGIENPFCDDSALLRDLWASLPPRPRLCLQGERDEKAFSCSFHYLAFLGYFYKVNALCSEFALLCQ